MGLALSIMQGFMKHSFAKGVLPDDIHWLGRQQDADVEKTMEEITAAMAEAFQKAKARIGKIFRIKRGGKRTTEQVIGATTHTFVNAHLNSDNFPLNDGPEDDRELVVFQVTDYDHDPSTEEVHAEFKTRGLDQPTYEDGLKFDEAYPDEKGVFVFLHKHWLGPGRRPGVLVVHRDEADRVLDLNWSAYPWDRHDWFVGVRPRK